jgi:DNA-binding response OmpR family regulator
MPHILIVDDEERITSFVTKGLAASGFTCVVSADGANALEQAQSGNFDAVVLDIGLPQLDGWEVLRRLRLTHPLLPVLILTARRSLEATQLGLTSGANDYMVKPFKLDELRHRLVLLLEPSAPAD